MESSVTGGVTTYSRNGAMSATSFSNLHRNFWLCQGCGNKFRNIQNLQEEIALEERKTKTYMTSTIVSLVIAVLAIFGMSAGPLMEVFCGALLVGGAFVALIYFLFRNSTLKHVEQMKQELAYLQANCF